MGDEGVTHLFDVKNEISKEFIYLVSRSQCGSAKVAQKNILSVLILLHSQSSPLEVEIRSVETIAS